MNQVLSQRCSKIAELFSIDLRALAFFRIGLGLLIIADLINRSSDLVAHYSDRGVLPRDVLIDRFLHVGQWSLHFVSGAPLVQAILFGVAGLFALALIVGYRTRLVTIVSWILLISLHSRNYMVLQGGDVLFRMLLFWAIFLPLGARFSIDSALNSPNLSDDEPWTQRVFSVGSVALLLQICLVYLITAGLKSHPRWWIDGTAIWYALNVDQFTTPLGKSLLSFPGLLKVSTYYTIYLEALGPLLLFVPYRNGPIRTVVTFLFMGLHAGFLLFMELGLFPYISMVGWIVFLPRGFWDRLGSWVRTERRRGLQIYYDGECGFCKKTVLILRALWLLPDTPVQTTQSDASIQADREAHNSWVVVDVTGMRHFGFEGLTYVLRMSPVLFWLAPLLRLKPILKIGEWLYQKIARNRRLGSWLTAPLGYRPLRIQLGRGMSILALIALLYVTLWNIRTTRFAFWARFFPRSFNGVAYALRLDQYWNMFAPYPLTDDGWYVIPGRLRNGEEVDVFQNGGPVSWDKPTLVSAMYPNQRWRKYMMNIWKKKFKAHRLYYGKYLCRTWNRRHQGDQVLETFEIFFMREDTPAPRHPARARKVKLWTHNCFPSR